MDEKTSNHLYEHHRNIQGGGARAAVFGVSDGLVTNVSLILGMAAADAHTTVVRLAGLAGLIAGAISMAAGEYVSMRAQRELFEREYDKEKIEQERNPKGEQEELRQIYESRGIDSKLAAELAEQLSKDPEVALRTHVREELGVDVDSFGSPIQSMAASFFAFAVGAFLPLIPWIVASGHTVKSLTVVSIGIGIVASLAVGALLARFTERSVVKTAVRQLLISTIAAGITYGAGKAVGSGPVG